MLDFGSINCIFSLCFVLMEMLTGLYSSIDFTFLRTSLGEHIAGLDFFRLS
jgi:hypothetical protein